MSEEAAEALGHKSRGLIMTTTEKLLFWSFVAVVCLVLSVVFFGDRRLSTIENTQASNRIVGLKNRAASCRVQLGQGLVLDDNCKDIEIAPYFNPDEKPNIASATIQNKNRGILCATIRADHPDLIPKIEQIYGHCEDPPKPSG